MEPKFKVGDKVKIRYNIYTCEVVLAEPDEYGVILLSFLDIYNRLCYILINQKVITLVPEIFTLGKITFEKESEPRQVLKDEWYLWDVGKNTSIRYNNESETLLKHIVVHPKFGN